MTQAELQTLLQFFKTMADESRLRIVGLVGAEERSVGELAEALDLSEPTVSHHLARLRELGLVNLKAVGTSRYYRLNRPRLEDLVGLVFRLEAITRATARERPDTAWIDALDLEDWERKVFRDYFAGPRLKSIPTQHKKLLTILRWLRLRFEPGREYSEREVNDLLRPVHEDYARLRRELVESGLLERAGGGGVYWRSSDSDDDTGA